MKLDIRSIPPRLANILIGNTLDVITRNFTFAQTFSYCYISRSIILKLFLWKTKEMKEFFVICFLIYVRGYRGHCEEVWGIWMESVWRNWRHSNGFLPAFKELCGVVPPLARNRDPLPPNIFVESHNFIDLFCFHFRFW